MRNYLVNAVVEAMASDKKTAFITADLGFSVLEPIAAKFPDRFFNLGVAEQSIIGISAGLDLSGFKTFVYSMGNFIALRCVEQIRNDLVYESRQVTLISVGCGVSYGSLGYSHHVVEDISLMLSLGGIFIHMPFDEHSVANAISYEMTENKRPGYLRIPKNEVDINIKTIPTGIFGFDKVDVFFEKKFKKCYVVIGSMVRYFEHLRHRGEVSEGDFFILSGCDTFSIRRVAEYLKEYSEISIFSDQISYADIALLFRPQGEWCGRLLSSRFMFDLRGKVGSENFLLENFYELEILI
jgi:deoxyxylulose-5-phosphate synthase